MYAPDPNGTEIVFPHPSDRPFSAGLLPDPTVIRERRDRARTEAYLLAQLLKLAEEAEKPADAMARDRLEGRSTNRTNSKGASDAGR